VHTDRTIPDSKPDIIIRDNEEGTCILTPGDRNMIEKEAEVMLKYRDIALAIESRWNIKTEVILLILEATYRESTKSRNCQTIAILCTAHCCIKF
jgi:hypothetical protein